MTTTTDRQTDRTRAIPPEVPSSVSRPVVVVLDVDPEEVRSQANKLLKAAPTLPSDLIWETAWIGLHFDRGFVGDLISTIRSGGVRNVTRYVRGTLRKACEERGFSFQEMRAKVPEAPKVKNANGVVT